MKKVWGILLNIFMVIAIFTGCGKQDTVVSESNGPDVVYENSDEDYAAEEKTENDSEENIEDFEGFTLSGYNYKAESNGVYIVSTSGTSLYGLVNSKGEFVIPAEYDEMNFDGNGKILLKVEGKWGVYDTDGNEILPFEYDYISTGFQNYHVQKDGVDLIIDSNGASCIIKSVDVEN